MAEIVLVHGIAQEQRSADTLEGEWLPALAGGVRAAGDAGLADRLWRLGPNGADVRMAFYGNVFLDRGAQGDGDGELPPRAAALAEELALAWLTAGAERGAGGDAGTAQVALAQLGDSTGAQGRGAVRPVLNALAGLHWFAPWGIGLAQRFVWKALTQVSRYFTEEGLREEVLGRVEALIDEDTRLVVGHSLGSVVAYEAVHRAPAPVALLTLGSPLALRTIVYDRLRPQPPAVPPRAVAWRNLASTDDLVAAYTDIARFFPANAAGVEVESDITVDNGSEPHDARHYLNKAEAGRFVADALSPG